MLHESNLHPAVMEVADQGRPQMGAKGGYEASCSSLQLKNFHLSTAASTGSSCSTWEATEAAVASMCCLAGLASSKPGTSALQHGGQEKFDTVSAFQEHGRQGRLDSSRKCHQIRPWCALEDKGMGALAAAPSQARGHGHQVAQPARCCRFDGMNLGHPLGHPQVSEHVVGQVAPQAEVPLRGQVQRPRQGHVQQVCPGVVLAG